MPLCQQSSGANFSLVNVIAVTVTVSRSIVFLAFGWLTLFSVFVAATAGCPLFI